MRTLIAFLVLSSIALAGNPRPSGVAPSHKTPAPWKPKPQAPAVVVVQTFGNTAIVRTSTNPRPTYYYYNGRNADGSIRYTKAK